MSYTDKDFPKWEWRETMNIYGENYAKIYCNGTIVGSIMLTGRDSGKVSSVSDHPEAIRKVNSFCSRIKDNKQRERERQEAKQKELQDVVNRRVKEKAERAMGILK